MSMLCTLIRGQMSNTFFSIRGGQMSSPVNHPGGRCPHIPFFIGGQMSEGANVLHYSVVPVPLPVTFAVKSPRSPYLDNLKAFILGP